GEAAALVAGALKRDGVEIVCGAAISAVEAERDQHSIHYGRSGSPDRVDVDRILVAAGRRPNVERLGLEMAQVRYDTKKGVDVDDRLRTSNPRIYAIGDIASPFQFTHVADAHARMVVRNALFFGRARVSELVIPWVTYTSPELAHVGILREEVQRRAGEIDTVTVPLAEVDRAR